MLRHHVVALISGLAVGAFLGYEFAGSLNAYPPYSWIANYFSNQISSSGQ